MTFGNLEGMRRHLGAVSWIVVVAWMVACNSKPSPSKPSKPSTVKKTPAAKPAPAKPAPAKPAPATPAPVKPAPVKPVVLAPETGVKMGAWCVIYGSYPYGKLKTAQAHAKKVASAGLTKAHVFDTRAFLNLAIGELVVIGLSADEKATAVAEVKKAKGKKLLAFHKRCRTGSFRLPAIKTAKDIKPQPKMPTAAATLTRGSQVEVGCIGWSPKIKQALCVVGDERLGTAPDAEKQGWRIVSVGGKSPKVFVVSSWDPKTASPPDDAKRITPKLRKSLSGYLQTHRFVTLPESHDMVRGDELAFASPRVRFRFSQTKSQVKERAGSWTDYSNTLEVKCGKQAYATVHEWESTESGDVTVWRIHGTPHFILAASYEIGREGEIGGGSWAEWVDGAACATVAPK